jgi:hypothetical protein
MIRGGVSEARKLYRESGQLDIGQSVRIKAYFKDGKRTNTADAEVAETGSMCAQQTGA